MSVFLPRSFSSFLCILLGSLLYAFTVHLFILPGELMSSGSTGIALTVCRLTGFPLSRFILFFNLAMLLAGLLFLGRRFFFSTLASSLLYPLFLDLAALLFPSFFFTRDPLLNSLFGGAGIGLALGLVIRSGASTGGMDIPPLILQRYAGIPVALSLYCFDFVILAAQLSFHPAEDLLYGVLLLAATSFFLNRVLLWGLSQTEVKIISQRPEEIRQAILTRMDRGVTLFFGEGGYKGEKRPVLLTVVSPREVGKLKEIVLGQDPESFVIVSKAAEVCGRGFTAARRYL